MNAQNMHYTVLCIVQVFMHYIICLQLFKYFFHYPFLKFKHAYYMQAKRSYSSVAILINVLQAHSELTNNTLSSINIFSCCLNICFYTTVYLLRKF